MGKYSVGDQPMLSGENFKTQRPSRKLDAKLHGPVTIVSSEDRRKSVDRWKSYKKYEVHGKNQVSLEGAWKVSGFIGRNQVSLEGIRFCWLHGEYGVMMV
jgi:hypothetical protein